MSTQDLTIPLKRFILSIDSGVSVNAVDTPADFGQFGVLKTSCVYTGHFDSGENKAVVPEELDRVSCPVKANTLVVSRMNTPDLVGAAGLAIKDEPNIFLPDRLWQVSFDLDTASPRFVYWWTRSDSYRDQVKVACEGASSSMQNLDQSSFRNFAIPLLDVDRQESIANFLDYKTARIDALIAEKGRLLTVLRDYAHAQVSKLLVEGVSGSSLKATNKPYVVEAPGHWRVTNFKRAMHGMNQGWSPQCDSRPAEANEWGVLKVGCVNGDTFDVTENKALPETLEPDLSCIIRKGDVLMSRANTRELVGMAALVNGDYPNILLCDKLYRLDLNPEWVSPEYAVLLLRSENSRRQIELGASGASSSMQNISQDVLRELVVAFPPLTEQSDIVVAAEKVKTSCADLAKHAEDHIARLREYRSSLISAAVTGRLDIRSSKTQ